MGKKNSKEKKLLIIFLGVLVFLLCYFWGYQELQAEADALEIENGALEKRVAELKMKAEKQEEYERKTERMQEELRKFFVEFPVYVQIEDGIMDVIGLEGNADTYISSFTFGESVAVDVGVPEVEPTAAETAEDTLDQDPMAEESVSDTAGEETADTPAAGAASRYTLYQSPMDLSFETTYDGAKRLMQDIVSSDDKKSLTGLALSFDSSTGILSGTITYVNWFISGQDKAYIGADIPSVKNGTDNIFGTIDRKTDQKTDQTEKKKAKKKK